MGLLKAIDGITVVISVCIKLIGLIVIVSVASAEDIVDTALDILHVGRCLEYIIGLKYLALDVVVADASVEFALPFDLAAQVVAAIDMVAHPGEAVHVTAIQSNTTANPGLSMSFDVGITTAGECVEHTTITQVHHTVAQHRALEAATIDKLTLRHIWTAVCTFRHTGTITVQVDHRTIAGAGVFGWGIETAAVPQFADRALLTTAEDLEGVALSQVDSSTTPHLGVLTIATAEHVEGRAQHVHSLLAEDDTAVALGDIIGLIGIIVLVVYGLAFVILCHLVEQSAAVDDRLLKVDDHVAVHLSAVVAAAIDVTLVEAAGHVLIRTLAGGQRVHVDVDLCPSHGIDGVPHQSGGIRLAVPPERHDLHTVEVHDQTVTNLTVSSLIVGLLSGRTPDTAEVSGIVGTCWYIGIVAATHHLIIYIYRSREVHVVGTLIGHAAYIATAIERTHHRGVFDVVDGIDRSSVEVQLRYQVHGGSIHIGSHFGGIPQIDTAETLTSILRQDICSNHILTVVAQEHGVDDGIRAYLQLHHRIGLAGLFQRSAVTTHIDCTMNNGWNRVGSTCRFTARNTDRHLLGIGTEGI